MMIPIKATPKMGTKLQSLPHNLLQQPTKFRTHPFPSNPTPPHLSKSLPRTLKISCSKDKESLTDETLALELGLEIKKLNTNAIQREEALNKSRELLFTEVSNFAGLKSEDLKKKWKKMNEDEKWGLAKGFVAEWSAHFHPLSAKSVKDMVEEYLDLNDEVSDTVSGNLFPDLRKMLGFSPNGEE
ncbi:hypothetical protein BUALT_Bualt15G0058000 [Buddleja alternifolia]|uniref:DUF7026 domain-containing protein n=1 Tax=Buddleja alternifolia TaxID=168488 RepID=A0AAV6WNR7_9LAMI|nr:hypothetical protein BUALT_Bualt15G0058000 [Buddleja alternifolia]